MTLILNYTLVCFDHIYRNEKSIALVRLIVLTIEHSSFKVYKYSVN